MGIDGFIELFDRKSGASLGKTLAVQSKVLKSFGNETSERFDYYCDERDLAYWLQGNMPVLLIVSRPENDEAYWISIKEYFSDPDLRAKQRVRFSKTKNRFDSNAYDALLEVGGCDSTGLHLGPLPLDETLSSNLLPLTSYPSRIWIGRTDHKQPSEIWSVLNKSHPRVSGDWFLHDKSIISFQNLTHGPWPNLCDLGSTEDFETSEWAYSEDLDRRRQFVQLLNRSLKEQLYPEIRWWPKLGCYMFAGDLASAPIKIRYQSIKQTTQITVVSKYETTNKKGEKYVRLRHLAFRGQFRLFDDQWYLEILPSYVFTWDGNRPDRFHEKMLSGIKRIEGNRAVLSQVLLWAQILAQRCDLFRSDQSLRFGRLVGFKLPIGIVDRDWQKIDSDIHRRKDEFGLFDLNKGMPGET